MLEIAGTCMLIMFLLGAASPISGPVVLLLALAGPVVIVGLAVAAGPVSDQFGLVVVVALVAVALSEVAALAGLLTRVLSARARTHQRD